MSYIKILIIDDDLGDRKSIRRMLSTSSAGFIIQEASTDDEALSDGFTAPDAILLDHRLPGRSGLEALPDLRARWPKTAFLMLSGHGDEDLAKSAIQLGAMDYIAKRSLNQSSLVRMIKNGIEKARLHWKIEAQRKDLLTFSDVLIHDFKAPIRAVSFLAEQLAEDIRDGDELAVGRGLKLLSNASLQMSELVRSLSDHLKADCIVEMDWGNLKEVVGRALSALDRDICESMARIEVIGGEQEFFCAQPLVAQLLQNLIGNAIKFSGEAAPWITIKPTWLEPQKIMIEVKDRGIGVPPDYCEQIFEPFSRSPNVSGRPGTGLGLATCKKIVELHNGDIWCDSVLGAGTSIFFTLTSNAGIVRPSLTKSSVA